MAVVRTALHPEVRCIGIVLGIPSYFASFSCIGCCESLAFCRHSGVGGALDVIRHHTSEQSANTSTTAALGGFKISFLTDNVQGAMVVALIVIATITIGAKTKIDPALIEPSGLTHASLLGWQLLYILPVAITTNFFFLSNFWLRTFASRTDKDLWVGVGIAATVVLIVLTLVGVTGLIAAWSGAWDGTPESGGIAFFLLLEQLPNWVVGIVLVMVVTLSTAAFDSLQSAMVSSTSNDVFRNRLNIWFVRGMVVLVVIPVVVLAIKAPSVLQIYLITDLLSASVIPVLVLGLSDRMYFWRGCDVVVGGLGGIFTVFLFGLVFYKGDAYAAGRLLLLETGLYSNDWSAFGVFVAAPVGSLLWGFGSCAARLAYLWGRAKARGIRFDALDRPAIPAWKQRQLDYANASTADNGATSDSPTQVQHVQVNVPPGKFF